MGSKLAFSIQIGYSEYMCRTVPPDDSRLEDNNGLCDTKLKEIWVSETPDEGESVFDVLVHELVHAILHEACVRELDEHFEHVLVDSFGDFIKRHCILRGYYE
jgi:hypothetical protein